MVLRQPFFPLVFASVLVFTLCSSVPTVKLLAADANPPGQVPINKEIAGQGPVGQEEDADAPMSESRLQMPSSPVQAVKPVMVKDIETNAAPDAAVPDDAKKDAAKTVAAPEDVKDAAASPEKKDTPLPGDNKSVAAPGGAMEDYGPMTLRASLTPGGQLEKDKPKSFVLRLTGADGKPVVEEGLEERHTKKIHLLVADESLVDYQHVHPEYIEQQSAFGFSFTPKTAHNYFIWADVKPAGGQPQLVFMFAEGAKPCKTDCVDKSAGLKAHVGSYKGVLALENGGAKAGTPVQATLAVTGPGGKPVKTLEPVMGAYAHVAAFTSTPFNVAHVHPLGAEPKDDKDRGASPLSFMLHPERPGFLKVFVQLKIDGKDVFLPFGVTVKP